jgi:hypothetical protein
VIRIKAEEVTGRRIHHGDEPDALPPTAPGEERPGSMNTR